MCAWQVAADGPELAMSAGYRPLRTVLPPLGDTATAVVGV